MKRDCKSIPEIIRMLQGDKNRRSCVVLYKGNRYQFKTNKEIKGALILIKLLVENSKEMTKLLIGREEAEELHAGERGED